MFVFINLSDSKDGRKQVIFCVDLFVLCGFNEFVRFWEGREMCTNVIVLKRREELFHLLPFL